MLNNDYVLKVGKDGAPRLKLLNDMCNPSTIEFIEKNIKLKNKRILDLGCGIGILSTELAKKSLPNGTVVAADISQDQLDIAQSIANKSKVENITFERISAFDIDRLGIKFDLIYCRFLLAHLSSASDVIQKIIKLMHSESILICEEPNSVNSLYCKPEEPVFEKFKQAVFKQVEVSKANFSIGDNLHAIFSRNNLNAVQKRKTQATLNTSELKQQLWQGVVEISSLLVGCGFLTQDEIEKFVLSLKDFADHSQANVGYLECTQIAAKLQNSESNFLKCRL